MLLCPAQHPPGGGGGGDNKGLMQDILMPGPACAIATINAKMILRMVLGTDIAARMVLK